MGLDQWIEKRMDNSDESEVLIKWRNNYPVHNWCIWNLEDEIDNCKDTELQMEDLVLLSNDCKTVLEERKTGKVTDKLKSTMLEPVNNKYDDDYFDLIEKTKQDVDLVLHNINLKEGEWISYHPWW